jgi:hypothetical protein
MKRYRLTWNPSLRPRQPAGTSVGGQFREFVLISLT